MWSFFFHCSDFLKILNLHFNFISCVIYIVQILAELEHRLSFSQIIDIFVITCIRLMLLLNFRWTERVLRDLSYIWWLVHLTRWSLANISWFLGELSVKFSESLLNSSDQGCFLTFCRLSKILICWLLNCLYNCWNFFGCYWMSNCFTTLTLDWFYLLLFLMIWVLITRIFSFFDDHVFTTKFTLVMSCH